MEGDQWFEYEVLEPKDRWNELLLTGLRTSFGVDQNKLFAIFSPDETFNDKVKHFVNSGWMISNDQRFILTHEGRLKADYIAAELFR